MFSLKSVHVRGWCPPQRVSAPPNRKSWIRHCRPPNQSGFCIIKNRLIRLTLGSKAWAFERAKMWTFYIFETHTYEPNISLIGLMLIMQNPEYETEWQIHRNWTFFCCVLFILLHNSTNKWWHRKVIWPSGTKLT